MMAWLSSRSECVVREERCEVEKGKSYSPRIIAADVLAPRVTVTAILACFSCEGSRRPNASSRAGSSRAIYYSSYVSHAIHAIQSRIHEHPPAFDAVAKCVASVEMEEGERGYIFEDVRYTIIPSDELSDDKHRLVRMRVCIEYVEPMR